MERGVPCDQKLDCGDHTWVCDEVEEAGDVLLVEDEVIRGVIALQQSPDMTKEWEDIRE